uniref:Uncharacterized protein n=1 Tax=Arundo donax TaxID=35708 RepID=A0A0A9DTV2_ARUDO
MNGIFLYITIGRSTALSFKKTKASRFYMVVWHNRNKMAIEKSFPNKPTDVLFAGLSNLQRWRILLRSGDKVKIDNVAARAPQWTLIFVPNEVNLSNVVFFNRFRLVVVVFLLFQVLLSILYTGNPSKLLFIAFNKNRETLV